MRLRSLFAVSAAMAAISCATTVFAQTTGDVGQDGGAETRDAPAGGVQDIIVTAQRRAESSQDVPISIVAFSGDSLASRGISGLANIETSIPSLRFTHGGSSIMPTLRGVGSQINTPGAEPAVALFVDGVYMPSTAGAFLSFNNIDSIEVDKGPQGTLFGRNATGGVIQVNTRSPSHTPGADLSLGYGNLKTVTGQFYGTTGLADNLAADLAVYWHDQGKGYGRNNFDGSDIYYKKEVAVRSKWVYEASDTLSATLTADYARYKGDASDALRLLFGTGIVGQSPEPFYETRIDHESYGINKQYGASLKIDKDLGFAHLVSISAARKVNSFFTVDDDLSPIPVFYQDFHQGEFTFTQELQLASPDDSKIKWIAGAFYLRNVADEDPLSTNFPSAPPGSGIFSFSEMRTDSISAFGQATVPLSERTRLTLGARYTIDWRSETNHSENELGDPLPNTIGAQSVRYSDPSWRITLDHDLADDVMLFASYDRGFKSGFFSLPSASGAPDTGPAARPETIDAFQVGLKTRLFDRKLQFNVSTFYYKYEDLQVIVFSVPASILLNAASSRIKGVDVDFSFAPVPSFTLHGALSYLDAKYSRFPEAPFFDGLIGYAGDAKGKRMPQSPEFSGYLAAEYRQETKIGNFDFTINGFYSDRYYFDVQNIVPQKSYVDLSASLKWTSPSERFDVTLWGRNMLDNKLLNAGATTIVGPIGTPQAPITYGVTLGAHF